MARDHDLALPDYDQLSLGDLQHRVRFLHDDQLGMLIDHERGHGERIPILKVLELATPG